MRHFFVLFTSLLTCSAWSTTYQFDDQPAKVEFLAKGRPALISIRGTGEGLEGSLKEEDGFLSGTIKFDLDKFDTGIGLRNEHMKEKYLETHNHRHAILYITKMKKPETGTCSFEAEMELKGSKKPVKGTCALATEGDKLKLRAEFPLKLSDFNIGVPSYQGVTVAEDVQVTVQAEVKVQ